MRILLAVLLIAAPVHAAIAAQEAVASAEVSAPDATLLTREEAKLIVHTARLIGVHVTTPLGLPIDQWYANYDETDDTLVPKRGLWVFTPVQEDATLILQGDLASESDEWVLEPQKPTVIEESHAYEADDTSGSYYAYEVPEGVAATGHPGLTTASGGPLVYAYGYSIRDPEGRVYRTGNWTDDAGHHIVHLVGELDAGFATLGSSTVYAPTIAVDGDISVPDGTGTAGRYSVHGAATLHDGTFAMSSKAGVLRIDEMRDPAHATGAVTAPSRVSATTLWTGMAILALLAALAFPLGIYGSSTTWLVRATRALESGRYRAAIRYARLSMCLRETARAYLLRGQARRKLGHPGAAADLEIAYRDDSSPEARAIAAAHLAHINGATPRGKAWLERAYQLAPDVALSIADDPHLAE